MTKAIAKGKWDKKELSFEQTLGYNFDSLLCLGDAQTFARSVSSSSKPVVWVTNSNILAVVSTDVAIAPTQSILSQVNTGYSHQESTQTMNNIFSKLRDFVGLNEQVEYEYYEEEPDRDNNYQNLYQQENPQPPAPPESTAAQNRRWREPVPTMGDDIAAGSKPMGNVIGMPGAINGISEVLVLEPRTFEEMPQAIQALRERKSVVLNLTIMDPDQAQRAVDFVAGGTYALDGHQERIGESIFLFTPSCVQVSTQGGVLHEVPQPPTRSSRPTGSPNQTWGNETNRMAQ